MSAGYSVNAGGLVSFNVATNLGGSWLHEGHFPSNDAQVAGG